MTRRTKNVNLIANVIGVDFNKHKIKTPYKDLKSSKKRAQKGNQQENETSSRVEVTEKNSMENNDIILLPPVPAEVLVEKLEEFQEEIPIESERKQVLITAPSKDEATSFFSFNSNVFKLIRKYFKPKNIHKGFSLIEVAIAIVVIGLVVGLSLKGRELIHTAKVNSVIDQVNSFRVATQMFTEKYGSMPGDFSDAKNSIDESLENGNGSGLISSLDDAKRFWSHLTKSGFLTAEFVAGFPVSKLGGYYSVSSDINENDGLWLVLTRGTSDNKSFSGIISQEDAATIDKKYDNGDPSSGDIRTKKIEGNVAKPTDIGKKYDAKSKAKNCVIMFKLW